MTVTPFNRLVCPLDALPLLAEGNRWHCANGHSFDNARQGYVNLLPVQNKRSLAPGDSKEMVAARQRFLNAGYYQPLAEAIARLIGVTGAASAVCEGAETFACLDAGCGEGYYLRQLATKMPTQNLALAGLDISKWAVLAAAKQSKQVRWVVASNANIPLADHSLDAVMCLFGFPVYGEFQRVLKTAGRLVLAEAGPQHLRELRETVYPVLKPDARKPSLGQSAEGFHTLAEEMVCFTLALTDAGAIADLLAMTPHFYRTNTEGRARAAELTELQVTVQVRLTLLEAVPMASVCAETLAPTLK